MALSLDYLNIKKLFDAQLQYIIPLYQRTYCWAEKQWQDLWEDVEHVSQNMSLHHFLGSVVVLQLNHHPGSMPKYILIDGQQRLSTIQILIKVISDQLNQKEIAEQYLINQYSKQINERTKIYPTKSDKNIFEKIILSNHAIDESPTMSHPMISAYQFFLKKLNSLNEDEIIHIKNAILDQLKVVYINLDKDDNPYEIFESLNAKGAPLTQSDLIRNFLFMQFASNETEQDEIYQSKWYPIEEKLNTVDSEQITKFIRHYLVMQGISTTEKNVYQVFSTHYKKECRHKDHFINLINDINDYAMIYAKLLFPNKFETDLEIKRLLANINHIEVTTSYPLLMYLFDLYQKSKIDKKNLIHILNLLIYYLMRKFICAHPSSGLNKTFIAILADVKKHLVENSKFDHQKFKEILLKRSYPSDEELSNYFIDATFYYKNSNEKTKVLLCLLEQSFSHKEKIEFDDLTIEHIMPQSLSNDWKRYFINQNPPIDEADITVYTHTIGNLTLTGYNNHMSNHLFEYKKDFYANSKLELNKQIAQEYQKWDISSIKNRAQFLLQKFVSLYGVAETIPNESRIPHLIKFNDKHITVNEKNWKGLLVKLFFILKLELHEEQWAQFKVEFNKFIKPNEKDVAGYTNAIKIAELEYLEINMSKKDIIRSIKKISSFLQSNFNIHLEIVDLDHFENI